jgi:hypothetical protein
MDDRPAYVVAKFAMWLLCLGAFVGWFLLALARAEVSAMIWSAFCFAFLLIIPLIASRLRHH